MRFLNLITAVSLCEDGRLGIGNEGKIPWTVHADMKYFKEKTQKSVLIMGRKTWESIPEKHRNFEGRYGIVVISSLAKEITTKTNNFVQYASSLVEAISRAWKRAYIYKESDENVKVFICGGENVYAEAMKKFMYLMDEMHITLVPGTFIMDTFFPIEKVNMDTYLSLKMKLKEIDDPTVIVIGNIQTSYLNLVTGETRSFPTTSRFPNKSNDMPYYYLVNKILNDGEERLDRTGVGTKSIFAQTLTFDLQKGFPLITRKNVFWRGCFEETLMFLKGKTDTNKYLKEKGIHIWDGNTSREFLDKRGLSHLREGDLGCGYGFQWRHAGYPYKGCDEDYEGKGYDQIKTVFNELKNNPNSRRHVVSAWIPQCIEAKFDEETGEHYDGMALPPCHIMFQFYVRRDEYLDCQMYQRSCDVMLGLPFNLASYSLITHIFAHKLCLKVGKLTVVTGDTHIYSNHFREAKEFLSRPCLPFPTITMNFDKDKDFDDLEIEDFTLNNYYPLSPIKMEMAV